LDWEAALAEMNAVGAFREGDIQAVVYENSYRRAIGGKLRGARQGLTGECGAILRGEILLAELDPVDSGSDSGVDFCQQGFERRRGRAEAAAVRDVAKDGRGSVIEEGGHW
jgi:hypothetical protein